MEGYGRVGLWGRVMVEAGGKRGAQQSMLRRYNEQEGSEPGIGHVGFESGELDAARSFLSMSLTSYPSDAFSMGI
jgi:hypothetical protein